MVQTVRDLLLRRVDDQRTGLAFEERTWTWAESVQQALDVAAALRSVRDPSRPFHVGALLDNVPEMHFLISAAALDECVVVGLNTTRRGEGLAADVRKADCQIVVTESRHRPLLDGLDLGGATVWDIDSPEWATLLAAHEGSSVPDHAPSPDDLMMLIFTSGTSGDPKAVRVTDLKVFFPGQMLAERFGLTPDDVTYVSMPLFHSNAVMAGWAPAVAAGTTIALARRFSASGFLPDVRRFGVTFTNYVGKPLSYVMATPEQPDDADNPLRVVFGNEAAERDIAAFAQRFGCVVVDSYSSTENAVIVQRTPDQPPGSLGVPLEGVKVLDPHSGDETPDAEFGPDGALLNPDTAIGELVNTTGAGFFAGYYNDEAADADRMRDGMYWSGDLAYRDADGFVYFAGRSSEWMRVDGENLAAAPIERVLLRHPDVSQAAVYAVPDPAGPGDQVAAALVLLPGAEFDPVGFEAFLDAQPDLGTKSRPRYLRVAARLPQTPTNKVLKRELAGQGVTGIADPVWERAERGTAYQPR